MKIINLHGNTVTMGSKDLIIEELANDSCAKGIWIEISPASPADWATFVTGDRKTIALTNKVYYYFDKKPEESIKGWHYVKGVPTIW